MTNMQAYLLVAALVATITAGQFVALRPYETRLGQAAQE